MLARLVCGAGRRPQAINLTLVNHRASTEPRWSRDEFVGALNGSKRATAVYAPRRERGIAMILRDFVVEIAVLKANRRHPFWTDVYESLINLG